MLVLFYQLQAITFNRTRTQPHNEFCTSANVPLYIYSQSKLSSYDFRQLGVAETVLANVPNPFEVQFRPHTH